jgi:hypothetical protein
MPDDPGRLPTWKTHSETWRKGEGWFALLNAHIPNLELSLAHTWTRPIPPHLVAFSPGGRLMVTVDVAIQIFELTTGKKVASFSSDHNIIPLAASLFTEDEQYLIAVFSRSVDCYDLQTKTCRSLTWDEPQSVYGASFSLNGSRLVTISRTNIKVWDLTVGATFTIRASFSRPCNFEPVDWPSFSIDGKLLCYKSSKAVLLWDIDRNMLIAELVDDSSNTWNSPITLRFSPDGQKLLESCNDGARMWNLSDVYKNIESNREIPLVPSYFPPTIDFIFADTVCWGGDGKSVLWVPSEDCVEGWSVDGQPLFSLNGDIVGE